MELFQGMTKVIHIVDPQSGMIQETEYQHSSGKDKAEMALVGRNTMESLGLGKYTRLSEAATTSEFPVLLRQGLKQILFSAYNDEPSTYGQWVAMEQSDKPAEDYLEMNRMGTLPVVGESDPYPMVSVSTDRVVRVVNNKRGYIFPVSEEMIKFDKSNQIRQYPLEMGAAAKQTYEEQCYSVLSTSGNYVRNSTTGDNDVGANFASTTFSATGLVTAYGTIRSMKDRRSGRYLNIVPDTLVVTPRLEFAAKQLLMNPDLFRAGTGATSPGQEVYGTGGANPFRGLIQNIIVSPYFGTTFGWALLKSKRAVTLQEVEPLQLLQAGPMDATNEAYLQRDELRYRVRIWIGVGMTNDRFAFLSTSTTAPTVG